MAVNTAAAIWRATGRLWLPRTVLAQVGAVAVVSVSAIAAVGRAENG